MSKSPWSWLFSLKPRERAVKDAAEKLQMNMRVTAQCRFNAAERLRRQGSFAFFTTTLLSIGLVFIPIMQNAGVPLAFKPNVLNMMQIFLAVSVLVCSVVIGTARYDYRAEVLAECGDKLQDLIHSLDKDQEIKGGFSAQDFANIRERFSEIVADTEKHSRSDFKFAMLAMRDDYFISGIPRLYQFIVALSSVLSFYVIPVFIILFEVTFIMDMLSVTKLLSPHLNGVVPELTIPAPPPEAAH